MVSNDTSFARDLNVTEEYGYSNIINKCKDFAVSIVQYLV